MFDDVLQAMALARALQRSHKGDSDVAVSFLVEVVQKRNEAYADLWELIGGICPPRLLGGIIHREYELTRNDVKDVYEGVEAWYQKNGLFLDPVSRFWLISLRERLAMWVIQAFPEDGKKPEGFERLDFHGEGLKCWLAKTALRMSLTYVATNVKLSKSVRKTSSWMRAQTHIRRRLELHYQMIMNIWSSTHNNKVKNALKSPEKVSQDLQEMIGPQPWFFATLDWFVSGLLHAPESVFERAAGARNH